MHRSLAAPPARGLRLGAQQCVGEGVGPCQEGEGKPGQWVCRGDEITIHSHSESWTEKDLKVRAVRMVQGPTAGTYFKWGYGGLEAHSEIWYTGQRISCIFVPSVGFRMVAIREEAQAPPLSSPWPCPRVLLL